MAELPEIMNLAAQMQRTLIDKVVQEVEVNQPKCLNMPVDAFRATLLGQRFRGTIARGKWLVTSLPSGWLLISLGMGGDLLYHADAATLPEKRRVAFSFRDGSYLSLSFWWFGYVHYARELAEHAMVAKLGPNALDLSLDDFRALLQGKRGAVKTLLMDQSHIAGIGNVYVQDPLFKARIHPLRPANSLSEEEIAALWQAIRETLQKSVALGGFAYEKNLYGEKGRWDTSYFQIAYREGKACPRCGAVVTKIKTGSTSGFICPTCQPLELDR